MSTNDQNTGSKDAPSKTSAAANFSAAIEKKGKEISDAFGGASGSPTAANKAKATNDEITNELEMRAAVYAVILNSANDKLAIPNTGLWISSRCDDPTDSPNRYIKKNGELFDVVFRLIPVNGKQVGWATINTQFDPKTKKFSNVLVNPLSSSNEKFYVTKDCPKDSATEVTNYLKTGMKWEDFLTTLNIRLEAGWDNRVATTEIEKMIAKSASFFGTKKKGSKGGDGDSNTSSSNTVVEGGMNVVFNEKVAKALAENYKGDGLTIQFVSK